MHSTGDYNAEPKLSYPIYSAILQCVKSLALFQLLAQKVCITLLPPTAHTLKWFFTERKERTNVYSVGVGQDS